MKLYNLSSGHFFSSMTEPLKPRDLSTPVAWPQLPKATPFVWLHFGNQSSLQQSRLEKLKVMSYNTQHLRSVWTEELPQNGKFKLVMDKNEEARQKAFACLIQLHQPDVVLLQEVQDKTALVELVQRLPGYNYALAPNQKMRGFYLAVLYNQQKHTLKQDELLFQSKSRLDEFPKRGVQRVRLSLFKESANPLELDVYNVHLKSMRTDGTPEAAQQLRTIKLAEAEYLGQLLELARSSAQEQTPALLGGDFNMPYHWKHLGEPVGATFYQTLQHPEATGVGVNPLLDPQKRCLRTFHGHYYRMKPLPPPSQECQGPIDNLLSSPSLNLLLDPEPVLKICQESLDYRPIRADNKKAEMMLREAYTKRRLGLIPASSIIDGISKRVPHFVFYNRKLRGNIHSQFPSDHFPVIGEYLLKVPEKNPSKKEVNPFKLAPQEPVS